MTDTSNARIQNTNTTIGSNLMRPEEREEYEERREHPLLRPPKRNRFGPSSFLHIQFPISQIGESPTKHDPRVSAPLHTTTARKDQSMTNTTRGGATNIKKKRMVGALRGSTKNTKRVPGHLHLDNLPLCLCGSHDGLRGFRFVYRKSFARRAICSSFCLGFFVRHRPSSSSSSAPAHLLLSFPLLFRSSSTLLLFVSILFSFLFFTFIVFWRFPYRSQTSLHSCVISILVLSYVQLEFFAFCFLLVFAETVASHCRFSLCLRCSLCLLFAISSLSCSFSFSMSIFIDQRPT